MTKSACNLWQLYQNTWFFWPVKQPPWPSFAIVTACNPKGETYTAEQNCLAHQKLMQEVDEHPAVCVVAGDRNMQHQELSLALVVSEKEAVSIARRYNQNAIFMIRDNQLELVPVLLEGVTRVGIGNFSDFVLPDSVGFDQL